MAIAIGYRIQEKNRTHQQWLSARRPLGHGRTGQPYQLVKRPVNVKPGDRAREVPNPVRGRVAARHETVAFVELGEVGEPHHEKAGHRQLPPVTPIVGAAQTHDHKELGEQHGDVDRPIEVTVAVGIHVRRVAHPSEVGRAEGEGLRPDQPNVGDLNRRGDHDHARDGGRDTVMGSGLTRGREEIHQSSSERSDGQTEKMLYPLVRGVAVREEVLENSSKPLWRVLVPCNPSSVGSTLFGLGTGATKVNIRIRETTKIRGNSLQPDSDASVSKPIHEPAP